MCGISGILHHRAPHAEQAVAAMLRAMAHRGPDGSGTLTFAGGAAGMVRLALVDLSARGQQPMWSPNHDVAILWNGEMYNFREERAGLGEYPFHSHTDTEVALALYLTHGDEFLARLRGMFATAIFDWRGRSKDDAPRVLLARDRFGIKPLYLAERGETLAFASEVRALVASGVVDGEICPEGLDDYLRYGFVVQPRTILRGVRMMEPGTAAVIESATARRAWRFAEMPRAEKRAIDSADAARELRAVSANGFVAPASRGALQHRHAQALQIWRHAWVFLACAWLARAEARFVDFEAHELAHAVGVAATHEDCGFLCLQVTYVRG